MSTAALAVDSSAVDSSAVVRDGPVGERGGQLAVQIRWDDDSPSRTARSLGATVTNNTANRIELEISALGACPAGVEQDVYLGQLELDPQVSSKIDIEVEAIPVQTTNHWSSVALFASYFRDFGAGPLKQQASTLPLYVTTSETDWGLAVIRSGEQQAMRDNEESLRGVASAPTRLRVREKDRMRELDTAGLHPVTSIELPAPEGVERALDED